MTPDEFLQIYRATNQRKDLDAILALIADDAIYWFSDGTCHIGKSAIEKIFRSNSELIQDDTYQMLDVIWLHQSTDSAACTFRFEWTGIVRGQRASGSGRGTWVLKKTNDSWRIVHEHLSKCATID